MKPARLILLGVLLLTLGHPTRLPAEPVDNGAIAYLTKLQQKDGGFLPDAGKNRSSLRAASAAIRALKYLGGSLSDTSTVANFVKSCHDKASGGFADTPGGKPEVAITAVGLMAVVELKMPVEDYEAAALRYLAENVKSFEDIRIAVAGLEALGKKTPLKESWLEDVLKLRNPDGTYGKGAGVARDTGSAVVAVLRMGGKVSDTDIVLKTLNAGQHKSGGFARAGAEPDLETSYRVVRAFHMLKTRPDGADKLRAFISKCRNADGGYGIMLGKPSSVSGTYFASILLHWLN